MELFDRKIPSDIDKSESRLQSMSPEEVTSLKEAKKRTEQKLKLMKKKHEEELAQLNEYRVENILKNNGAREYFERLKDRTKIQEELIRSLKEDLESQSIELEELRRKFRDAEKKNSQYLKAWKEVQIAKERLEKEPRIDKGSESIRSNHRSIIFDSSSSVVDSLVPPPPLAEAPSVDELLNTNPVSSGDTYGVMCSDILPPPPEVEVPLEEILSRSSEKAFELKKGQFICHSYVKVDLETSLDAISRITELIQERQTPENPSCESTKFWRPISDSKPHVTLLRGHRVIYNHQIKPLITAIQKECQTLKPFRLFLDSLEIFDNNEGTKQFLCIAIRQNQAPRLLTGLIDLKRTLMKVIDQYADKLTDEDETDDTLPHCSLMYRDTNHEVRSPEEVKNELDSIDAMLSEELDEFPACVVGVEAVHITVGNHEYIFKLSG